MAAKHHAGPLGTVQLLRFVGQVTQRRHALAKSIWQPSSLPAWLNEETYLGKIQPLLAGLTNKAIASALGTSIPYASAIRAGRRVPHPRHWLALAQLVGITADVYAGQPRMEQSN